MTRRIALGRLSLHLVTRPELPVWNARSKRDIVARYWWLDLYKMRLCVIWSRKVAA